MKKRLLGLIVSILLISTALPAFGIYIHEEQVNKDADTMLIENDDWPMFCPDPKHSEFSTPAEPNTNNVLCNYATGSVSSSPVADGKVCIGSDDGNIYCFRELNQSNKPRVSGPTAGGPEIELSFSAVYADPEEDQIYYLWDWDDGNFSDWLGPFDSNESVTINYSWVNNGEYKIQVKAKDINNTESSWSEPHNISIATQIELSNLQLGFIYLRTFFTNNSYAYTYLLETLGVSVVLSDEGLCTEATATDAVDSVTFELIDLLWEDQINQEDDNSSDGFSSYFELSSGLFQITVYAYDENETLIDMDRLDYLVFIDLTSGDESQQAGPFCKIRYRLRERFRDRLLRR